MDFNLFRGPLRNNKRKNIIIEKNTRGRFSISLNVLKEIVENKLACFSSVYKSKVEVTMKNALVYIFINSTVCRGKNTLSLKEKIKNAVREEIFDITNLRIYNINVTLKDLPAGKKRVE